MAIYYLVIATLPCVILTVSLALVVTVRLYLCVFLKPRVLIVSGLRVIMIIPPWLAC